MARDKIIVGIDVGSSKIATLIGSLTGDDKINIVGVANTEARGMRKGQVIDIEEASACITQSVEAAERMAGYTVGTAFISVGGAHIISQNSRGVVAVSEPEGEINQSDVERVMEASRAISLPTAREIIHAIPRGFIVDSQEGIKDPIGMNGVRLEVDTHIVSGGTTAIRNLAKCIGEIGVEIDGLVFGGLASSESVLTDTEKELGVALVDLGGGTTDICIFVDGALSYSAVLPVGAKNITNDLAIGLRVSLESAEKIKIALGQKQKSVIFPKEEIKDIKNNNSHQGVKEKVDEINLTDLGLPEGLKSVSKKTLIDGIIKPRLLEIFTLVGIELQKSGFGGATPAGIVVTGGGAETIGIVEAAKQRLALPVRLGFPEGMTGLIDEIQGPSFATAVGLLTYGSKNLSVKEGRKEGMGKIFKSPIKGASGKIINLLKSFLP